MQAELSIPELTEHERFWLEAVYEVLKKGQKPNGREIRVALYDKLPINFHPASINLNLISASGERITLLGIMAVEGNASIMEKADRIIMAVRNIIFKQPTINNIQTTQIAEHTELPETEVGLILDLIGMYGSGFYRSASYKPDSFEIISISLQEDFVFHQYMRFTSIEPMILHHLQISQTEDEEQNLDLGITNVKNKDITAARQVLAMNFLLKSCGINPVDKPTPVTRFIQFLTRRELNAKRIQDTTIYKHVTKPYKLNDEELLKDLNFIRNYFSDMGLANVVVSIDAEIAQSQKSG